MALSVSDRPGNDAIDPPFAPERGRRTKYATFARVVVSVLLVSYLVYRLDTRQLMSQLARVQLLWVVMAMLLMGATYVVGGVRWWLLLRIQDVAVGLRRVVSLTFIGQFFNSFF